MSLLKSLQSDLRAISTEARRKQPHVKDISERAMMKMRHIEDRGSLDAMEVSQELAQIDEIFQSITQSVTSDNERLVVMGMTALQRVVSHYAFTEKQVQDIAQILEDKVNSEDETILLRLLQIISALVNSTIIIREDIFSKIIGYCFRLHLNRTPTVHHTACATIQQIITSLFGKVKCTEVPNKHELAKDFDQAKDQALLSPYVKDIVLLTKDICMLAKGDPALWIQVSAITNTFALELIETVLHNNSAHFEVHDHLLQLLRERIAPMIVTSFHKKHEFPYALRIMRIVTILLRQYIDLLPVECSKIICSMNLYLKSDHYSWQRALILESFKATLAMPQTIRKIFSCEEIKKENPRLFEELNGSFCRMLRLKYTDQPDLLVRAPGKGKYIEMLSESEPPSVPDLYFASQCLDCVLNLADGFFTLLCPEDDLGAQISDVEGIGAILNEYWGSAKVSFTYVLERLTDEKAVQVVLQGYQNVIMAVSKAQNQNAQKNLLDNLCRLAMPMQESGVDKAMSLSFKNVLVLQRLFNLAHKLGNHLGANWLLLFRTFEHLERLMQAKGPQDVTFEFSRINPENSILTTNLTDLFKNTKYINDASILECLDALRQLSERPQTMDGSESIPITNVSNATIRRFGMSRTVEIGLNNIYRMEKLWPRIISFISEKAVDTNPVIRDNAVTHLIQLIGGIFAHTPNSNKGSDAPTGTQTGSKTNIIQGDFDPISFQDQMLTYMNFVVKCNYPDTSDRILQFLHQTLQSHGQMLSSGWPEVISMVVGGCKDEQTTARSFKIAQYICTDFLSSLPKDCIQPFVDMAVAFIQQNTDINISLSAIGLLWNVSDFLLKIHGYIHAKPGSRFGEEGMEKFTDEDLAHFWIVVFTALAKVTVDHRPEVRNSALRTLFTSLATDGSSFTTSMWEDVIWKVLFPTVSTIDDEAIKSAKEQPSEPNKEHGKGVVIIVHHSRNTAQKQWDETKVAAITGVSRVLKIYMGNLCDIGRFEHLWKHHLDVLTQAAKNPSKEIALVAMPCWGDVVLSMASKCYRRSLWNEAWKVLEWIISNRQQVEASLKTDIYIQMMEQLDALLTSSRQTFLEDDFERLLEMLHTIVYDSILSCSNTILKINGLQTAVLSLYSKMVYATKKVMLIAFKHFDEYLLHDIASKAKSGQEAPSISRSMALAPFPEKVIASLSELYISTTWEVQDLVIDNALLSLAQIAANKNHPGMPPTTWIQAVRSFIRLAKSAFAVDNAEFHHNRSDMIWTRIVVNLKMFLFIESERATEDIEGAKNIEIELIECVGKTILSQARHLSADTRFELVQMISSGCTLKPDDLALSATNGVRKDYITTCFGILFDLCARAGSRSEEPYRSADLSVGQIAIRILLERCHHALCYISTDPVKSDAKMIKYVALYFAQELTV
eukprot:TRINITY_DN7895_c0_g1_i2.p1 TRINITY_DN7895_c0_g1~~TRINITY_DN7895_c0_g1_i2.p1  ORF type:complete len:1408 (+),score=287.78 TRINITY_DN7895_c0_g1_i2:47-4270(+)